MLVLLRFLDILVGRRQNMIDLHLSIKAENESLAILQVYGSAGPRRDSLGEDGTPASIDVLIDGVKDPERFKKIVANWLDRQETWHDARMRFDNSFAGQRRFTIDRLV